MNFSYLDLMKAHDLEYSDLNCELIEKRPKLTGQGLHGADIGFREYKSAAEDTDRIAHLKKLIEQYYWSPGNAKISP